MQCPVVKVKFDNEQGYYLLNEADFDESKHELFIEPPVTEISQTEGTVKSDVSASVAKTQDVGVAGPKPPWVSKRTKL